MQQNRKKPMAKDFQLIKDGVFNSNYPAGYNLITGYCTPQSNNVRPFIQDIKVLKE